MVNVCPRRQKSAICEWLVLHKVVLIVTAPGALIYLNLLNLEVSLPPLAVSLTTMPTIRRVLWWLAEFGLWRLVLNYMFANTGIRLSTEPFDHIDGPLKQCQRDLNKSIETMENLVVTVNNLTKLEGAASLKGKLELLTKEIQVKTNVSFALVDERTTCPGTPVPEVFRIAVTVRKPSMFESLQQGYRAFADTISGTYKIEEPNSCCVLEISEEDKAVFVKATEDTANRFKIEQERRNAEIIAVDHARLKLLEQVVNVCNLRANGYSSGSVNVTASNISEALNDQPASPDPSISAPNGN